MNTANRIRVCKSNFTDFVVSVERNLGTYNGEVNMATNPPKGDGHRIGAVKDRSQVYNPKTETWTKRDANTGQFMDGKKDGTPFKGVRKEK
jgi:hypothetical protein